MQNSKKIQWFPGHMTKAARQMEENLKKVDFVIEIRDARIPDSSRNPMLDGIIHTKPRLIILSKKDKADPKLTKEWITYLEKDNVRVIALDLVHENYKAAIVQASKTLCASFIEKQKRRGIKPRALRAMVCGIPNVGKSTMINTLAKRKAAKTADKPGVTKSLQWIKLDKDLELLDTPGVLWPKFDDQQIGLKLALLGSIRDEVVTMDELAMFAIEWLMENNPSSLIETYGIEIQDTPWHTLEQVAIKRGYLQKGQIDENRLMNSFVKDMRENKCGLITWEKPNVG
ncbi:ribosome biogenesis GTPase YlqF [Faecalitalea cylindroides]|uniref:ribosome biogenesis GTPase YlqF n=1 Tax=Faecalitalea cylindroides TaxID=39483 RepID=UPI00232EAD91|nr:ribosome biogenesis GTPase YlqF [Faecalitalea cylindroides]MDB7952432.1 ribosome biogenesis GTPase YlqF [Faecalitalea cylindroides]MDB7959162.1 ribosome biogenesis GTPase YlqF [Faecalitalea cylindroides]MDB7960884.1 ribosome biogenesis GTPase YlqF [Faecalitalea cylindroides]MDB7963091.1 ribosome biogenesis GTPase YlqF [Faecalitalea cylindroides]MDB7964862.1 ribosome biogenesis GTPase YlqF [Faecalitalea cylindroides]